MPATLAVLISLAAAANVSRLPAVDEDFVGFPWDTGTYCHIAAAFL
jgi:hypothetical protein